MNFDLSGVEFSNNDLVSGTRIPQNLTKDLAYFIGVHIGDGTLFLYRKGSHHYIICTGHLIDEYKFHKDIIIPLIKKLFNKDAYLIEDKRENRSSLRTYFKSKATFTFLSKVINLRRQ